MPSGDPHNFGYGGCWCGINHWERDEQITPRSIDRAAFGLSPIPQPSPEEERDAVLTERLDWEAEQERLRDEQLTRLTPESVVNYLARFPEVMERVQGRITTHVCIPPDTALRKAARYALDAWDEYERAHAGNLHDGPHAVVPMISEDECGQCVSDRYGTEITMTEYAMPGLRSALDG